MAPTKRSRGKNIAPAFGAAGEDDLLTAEPRQIPSASALSIRPLTQGGAIPMLTSLAARRFVENTHALSSDERLWTYVRSWLKRLPDLLVPKLFNMLQKSCPDLLSHELIVLVRAVSDTCPLYRACMASTSFADQRSGYPDHCLAYRRKQSHLSRGTLMVFASFTWSGLAFCITDIVPATTAHPCTLVKCNIETLRPVI